MKPEEVSVEAAIERGKRLLKYAPLAVGLGGIVFSVCVLPYTSIPGWLIGICILGSFVAGWLTWSILVTYWRIWALERVRNIDQLLEAAMNENLIWRPGSWMERTEIRSRSQRELIQWFEDGLVSSKLQLDDPEVPPSTEAWYSKPQMGFIVVFGIWMLSYAVGQLLTHESDQVLNFIIAVFGAGVALYGALKWRRDRPVIIINAEGISVKNEPFFRWESIADERIVTKSTGQGSRTVLVFTHPEGEVDFDIGGLSITENELRRALQTHRTRWKKKISGHDMRPPETERHSDN